MSETSDVDKEKEKEMVVDPDSDQKNQVDDGNKGDGDKDQILGEEVKDSQENDKNPTPSAQQEEEAIKKKYGGLLPKKPPLISKDHERAFFDSADWALGKQGAQKPKGPLEALRPKLQPTPHQQMRSRRSAYAPADDTEGDNGNNIASSSEDQSCTLDKDNSSHIADEDQIQGLHDKDKSQSG